MGLRAFAWLRFRLYVHFSSPTSIRIALSFPALARIQSGTLQKCPAEAVWYVLRQFEDRWLTDLDPVLHMVGLASPWLEPDSNDAFLADISAIVSRVAMGTLANDFRYFSTRYRMLATLG